jgi:hypothetical protein
VNKKIYTLQLPLPHYYNKKIKIYTKTPKEKLSTCESAKSVWRSGSTNSGSTRGRTGPSGSVSQTSEWYHAGNENYQREG